MSLRCPSRVLSKNALSFFLRQVIFDDGAVDEGALPPHAYSVHAVATLAAFLRNWSVSKVLEAATWRMNPVFPLFYFCDTSYTLDSCYSLWPFVAGGFRFNLSATLRFRVFSYCVHGHSRFMWVLFATLIGMYVASLGLACVWGLTYD